MERVHEIVFQGGIDGLRILLSFQFCFIDSDELLPFAGFFAKTIIGDPIKPGGKFRFAPKAANVFVSAQEGFLGEVVGQGHVVARELSQETTDGRLMIAHQFAKGVMIIIEKNSRDKVGIVQWHVSRLHRWGSVIAHVQSPHEKITRADQERDDAKAPGAAFPVIDRAEEDHQTRAHHQ